MPRVPSRRKFVVANYACLMVIALVIYHHYCNTLGAQTTVVDKRMSAAPPAAATTSAANNAEDNDHVLQLNINTGQQHNDTSHVHVPSSQHERHDETVDNLSETKKTTTTSVRVDNSASDRSSNRQSSNNGFTDTKLVASAKRRYGTSVEMSSSSSTSRSGKDVVESLSLKTVENTTNVEEKRVIGNDISPPPPTTTTTTIVTPRKEDKDDELFVPKNIGWPSRVRCGSQKCFYHLRSNRSVGYLVASALKKDHRFRLLDSGWQLAKQLERNYHIKHFLLTPPTRITVTEQLAARLNRNIYIERTQRTLGRNKSKKRFPQNSTVYVQRVKMAPRRHLLIGCVDSKVRVFQRNLRKFLPYVKDTQTFAQTINTTFVEVKHLLQEEPCLVKDFQIMVDTSGRSYHLDFDRCFRSSGRKFHMSASFTKACLQSLDTMNHQLQQAVIVVKKK